MVVKTLRVRRMRVVEQGIKQRKTRCTCNVCYLVDNNDRRADCSAWLSSAKLEIAMHYSNSVQSVLLSWNSSAAGRCRPRL